MFIQDVEYIKYLKIDGQIRLENQKKEGEAKSTTRNRSRQIVWSPDSAFYQRFSAEQPNGGDRMQTKPCLSRLLSTLTP